MLLPFAQFLLMLRNTEIIFGVGKIARDEQTLGLGKLVVGEVQCRESMAFEGVGQLFGLVALGRGNADEHMCHLGV